MRCYKTVDHTKIRKNYLAIRKSINSECKIMCIIKANAYGHGSASVCKSLYDADFFGVATFNECKVLIENMIKTPILILGLIEQTQIEYCIQNSVRMTVQSIEELIEIDRVASRLNSPAYVHIKLDTGMTRLGITKMQDFDKMLLFLSTSPHIKLEGIFSHFSNYMNGYQQEKFDKYVKRVNEQNIKCLSHLQASSTLMIDKFKYDMVRVGLSLYGYSKNLKLSPAMEVTSKIISIKKVKKNTAISYDGKFVCDSECLVACVPIGYADGLLRSIHKKGYFLVNGKKCKILGNICMDMTMIDVTKAKANIGDKVVIIGTSEKKCITAKKLAKFSNTSVYEILTSFRPRS